MSDETTKSTDGARTPWRERATDAVVIIVAWNFAIAQPLLDLFGKNPEFFVAHSASKLDILAFAFGLALLVPVLLAALLTGVGLLSRLAGRVAHRVVLGGLVAEFGLQIVKQIGLPGAFEIVLPIALGVGAAVLYDRRANLRGYSWWLVPAPVFFLVLFLASPVNGLIFTSEVDAGSDQVTIGAPAPVVVIVFDELPVVSLMRPDGTIDREAFPNFARLADRSTWFRNTTANWPNTGQSVPTIFTGKVDTGSVATASENPRSLFTLLGGTYDVEAFEAVTKLCPDALCGSAEGGVAGSTRVRQLLADTRVIAGHVLLPDDVADSLPAIDQSWGDFGDVGTSIPSDTTPVDSAAGARKLLAARDPTGASKQFSDVLTDARDRSLSVLHVEIPHVPWRFLPTGQQYDHADAIPGLTDDTWSDDSQLPRFGRARHLLQTQYADLLLGQLLDRMDQTGLSDRAALVVTADHGVAFRPGTSRRNTTPETIGDIAYVPLFVDTPGTGGRVDDRPASLDDIVPTLADALGAEAEGWDFDGRSLLADTFPADRERGMHMYKGDVIPIGPGTAARDDALDRKWATFPGATTIADPDVVYRTGRLADAVGLPAPPAPELTRGSVILDQETDLAHADPQSALVPALITGTIEGVPDGTDAIVVLNGTSAGAGRSFGSGRFAGLVSSRFLRVGANDVSVLVDTDDGLRSVPVASPPSWAATRRADGTRVLTSSDGKRASVSPDALDGYADIERTDGIVTLNGWAAADPPGDARLPIVIFRNDEFLASTTTGDARPDVARVLDDERLGESGFALKFPPSLIGDPKKDVISVYVVDGGTATELGYTAGYGYEQPPLADALLTAGPADPIATSNGSTVATGNGSSIATSDGRVIAIGDAGLRGAAGPTAAGIEGWVARGEQPFAGWLVAFVDGKAVWVGSTGAEPAAPGPPPRSGFEAPIGAPTNARVFAVVGGVAQELRPLS